MHRRGQSLRIVGLITQSADGRQVPLDLGETLRALLRRLRNKLPLHALRKWMFAMLKQIAFVSALAFVATPALADPDDDDRREGYDEQVSWDRDDRDGDWDDRDDRHDDHDDDDHDDDYDDHDDDDDDDDDWDDRDDDRYDPDD